MNEITIHEKPGCPYCEKAKNILDNYGYEYNREIYDPKSKDYEKCKSALMEYSNSNTFPQIYIGEHHVGGYEDLSNLSEKEFRSLVRNNK